MPEIASNTIDCACVSWSPGISDPGVAWWLTVVAYAIAAIFSLSMAARQKRWTLERLFWASAGASIAFLAINKQLDLQSFLTAIGRCAAKLQGWYDMRRSVQVDFVVGLIAAAVLGGAFVLLILRRTIRRTGLVS